jgi:hypothetical protein
MALAQHILANRRSYRRGEKAAPFLGEMELTLPAALALGLDSRVSYEETSFCLDVGDHLILYTKPVG